MNREINRRLLSMAILAIATGCRGPTEAEDPALARRIEQLVEQFLTSDDAGEQVALSDARAIFERDGVPSVARVGDRAAYRFVFINMVGQDPDFQKRFAASARAAGQRRELPEDAVIFVDARTHQAELEARYAARTPSNPALRDRIQELLQRDQAVRGKARFDFEKMEETDRSTAGPLRAIFDQYGVPTYDMVGVQAAKDFIVMVQHQSAAFRAVVLPKLKANVGAGQAEGSTFAMVYDRTQRDQGRNQLYGQQLECSLGKTLTLAPIDDPAHVDLRRAQLGLMRLDIYEQLVRDSSPDVCGAAATK